MSLTLQLRMREANINQLMENMKSNQLLQLYYIIIFNDCLGLQTEMLHLHDLIKDSDSQVYPKFKKISTHQDSSTNDGVIQHKLPSDDKQSLSQSGSMLNYLMV